MTDKNKRVYEKLNIDIWHKAGFLGKGAHVAVLGYEKGAWHNGTSIIKETAPACEITELNVMEGEGKIAFDDALQWCLDNDVDVICCSLQKLGWNSRLMELSQKLYHNGCIMIDSADNDSREIDRYPALDPHWFPIGAYDAATSNLAGYSNYGHRMLCLSHTGLDSLTAKGTYLSLPHTSGATQIPSGIAAILKQYCDISPKEFEVFVAKHSINLGEPGKDNKSGYGLLCLPKKLPDEYSTKITLWIGSKLADVNGNKKQLDVAPFISDQRTFVPIRFIAEALGCDVSWDPEKQKVTIQK